MSTESDHPSVAKATESHVRLVLAVDSQYMHSTFCPNGWADVPTHTSCRLPILRQIAGNDPFMEPCMDCMKVDIERDEVRDALETE